MTSSRNPNIDEALFDFSKDMVEGYLLPYVEEAGFTTGIYGSPGNWLPENILGFRHSIDILTESAGSLHPNIRVNAQMSTVEGVLQFYRENLEEIGTLVADAAERKSSAAARGESFHLDSSTIQEPMACGYLLHSSQAEKISRHIELLPLEMEEVSENGVFISMEQPMMTKIPLLLDEDSAYNLVDGLRLFDCTNPAEIEPPAPIEQTEPAQYGTDFSGNAVGEAPDGWTPMWKESSWTILENPHRLEHYAEGAGNGRRALTWDEAGAVYGDVEISGVVRASDTGDTMLQIGFHMSGERTDEVSSENYYYLDIRRPDANLSPNRVRINKVEDGNYELLGSAQMPFFAAEDTWYQVVLQREGDALRAKIWPFGEKEPAAFQVQVTDRSFDHGYVGVAHFNSFTVNEWAFIGVGTGGDSAPRAPEDVLDPKVNKAELQNRLDEINAENLNEADYTEESWQMLQNAMDLAENVLNDPDAKQSDIDKALAELNQAYDGLEEAGTINASGIITSVERLAEEGAFKNKTAVRTLVTHLTAVTYYEENNQAEKIIKHMESFKKLIFHQKENDFISEWAYNLLYADANALIENWK